MINRTLTRRQFIGYSTALGASLYLTTPLRAGDLDRITWVSPRGNLEVMDDFNLDFAIRGFDGFSSKQVSCFIKTGSADDGSSHFNLLDEGSTSEAIGRIVACGREIGIKCIEVALSWLREGKFCF